MYEKPRLTFRYGGWTCSRSRDRVAGCGKTAEAAYAMWCKFYVSY